MTKTRGAHSFRPWVRQGPTPPTSGPFTAGPSAGFVATGPSAAAGPSVAAAGAGLSMPTTRSTANAASPAPTAGDANGSSSVAPAQRRYHTQVGPTPPAPSHSRPARRSPLAKEPRTSGPRESSTSRSRALPSPPYQGIDGALDLSLGSIIRRPYFSYDPIPRNVSCWDGDFHGEVYYDLPAFAPDPRL